MSRQLIAPAEIHEAPGFSHVVIAPSGTTVHLSGQLPLDMDLSVIGGDDLGAQTRAAMRNVGIALAAVGATWEDVVRRTIYTLHPTEWALITEAMEEVQGSTEHPAQTLIGVTGFAISGAQIEIEVTAVISD